MAADAEFLYSQSENPHAAPQLQLYREQKTFQEDELQGLDNGVMSSSNAAHQTANLANPSLAKTTVVLPQNYNRKVLTRIRLPRFLPLSTVPGSASTSQFSAVAVRGSSSSMNSITNCNWGFLHFWEALLQNCLGAGVLENAEACVPVNVTIGRGGGQFVTSFPEQKRRAKDHLTTGSSGDECEHDPEQGIDEGAGASSPFGNRNRTCSDRLRDGAIAGIAEGGDSQATLIERDLQNLIDNLWAEWIADDRADPSFAHAPGRALSESRNRNVRASSFPYDESNERKPTSRDARATKQDSDARGNNSTKQEELEEETAFCENRTAIPFLQLRTSKVHKGTPAIAIDESENQDKQKTGDRDHDVTNTEMLRTGGVSAQGQYEEDEHENVRTSTSLSASVSSTSRTSSPRSQTSNSGPTSTPTSMSMSPARSSRHRGLPAVPSAATINRPWTPAEDQSMRTRADRAAHQRPKNAAQVLLDRQNLEIKIGFLLLFQTRARFLELPWLVPVGELREFIISDFHSRIVRMHRKNLLASQSHEIEEDARFVGPSAESCRVENLVTKKPAVDSDFKSMRAECGAFDMKANDEFIAEVAQINHSASATRPTGVADPATGHPQQRQDTTRTDDHNPLGNVLQAGVAKLERSGTAALAQTLDLNDEEAEEIRQRQKNYIRGQKEKAIVGGWGELRNVEQPGGTSRSMGRESTRAPSSSSSSQLHPPGPLIASSSRPDFSPALVSPPATPVYTYGPSGSNMPARRDGRGGLLCGSSTKKIAVSPTAPDAVPVGTEKPSCSSRLRHGQPSRGGCAIPKPTLTEYVARFIFAYKKIGRERTEAVFSEGRGGAVRDGAAAVQQRSTSNKGRGSSEMHFSPRPGGEQIRTQHRESQIVPLSHRNLMMSNQERQDSKSQQQADMVGGTVEQDCKKASVASTAIEHSADVQLHDIRSTSSGRGLRHRNRKARAVVAHQQAHSRETKQAPIENTLRSPLEIYDKEDEEIAEPAVLGDTTTVGREHEDSEAADTPAMIRQRDQACPGSLSVADVVSLPERRSSYSFSIGGNARSGRDLVGSKIASAPLFHPSKEGVDQQTRQQIPTTFAHLLQHSPAAARALRATACSPAAAWSSAEVRTGSDPTINFAHFTMPTFLPLKYNSFAHFLAHPLPNHFVSRCIEKPEDLLLHGKDTVSEDLLLPLRQLQTQIRRNLFPQAATRTQQPLRRGAGGGMYFAAEGSSSAYVEESAEADLNYRADNFETESASSSSSRAGIAKESHTPGQTVEITALRKLGRELFHEELRNLRTRCAELTKNAMKVTRRADSGLDIKASSNNVDHAPASSSSTTFLPAPAMPAALWKNQLVMPGLFDAFEQDSVATDQQQRLGRLSTGSLFTSMGRNFSAALPQAQSSSKPFDLNQISFEIESMYVQSVFLTKHRTCTGARGQESEVRPNNVITSFMQQRKDETEMQIVLSDEAYLRKKLTQVTARQKLQNARAKLRLAGGKAAAGPGGGSAFRPPVGTSTGRKANIKQRMFTAAGENTTSSLDAERSEGATNSGSPLDPRTIVLRIPFSDFICPPAVQAAIGACLKIGAINQELAGPHGLSEQVYTTRTADESGAFVDSGRGQKAHEVCERTDQKTISPPTACSLAALHCLKASPFAFLRNAIDEHLVRRRKENMADYDSENDSNQQQARQVIVFELERTATWNSFTSPFLPCEPREQYRWIDQNGNRHPNIAKNLTRKEVQASPTPPLDFGKLWIPKTEWTYVVDYPNGATDENGWQYAVHFATNSGDRSVSMVSANDSAHWSAQDSWPCVCRRRKWVREYV
ncbi:unnamed protein product [Amoebophrya sp. A120]|nr:unnamed protein product [Amoebophrya sp. A120]|eukprot:GSA120T00021272001.1